jgi:multicomponent Na+:H+ antiporter subunit E
MNLLTWNMALALLWATVTGAFSLANLLVGFAIGYVVLLVARPALGGGTYHGRLWRTLLFLVRYLGEMFWASLRVAYDVLTPPFHMRPGVIAIPLDAKTDVEITLLANLISLTPGTLALDVSSDRKVFYIHAMYIDDDDVERLRREIKDGLERRVLELLR